MVTIRAGAGRMPSRRVLSELPARVVTFLRATGTHSGVRAALAKGGFGPDDDREGWALLHAACGYRDGEEGLDTTGDQAAQSAAREASAWLGAHVPRLVLSIERLHPDELELFSGVAGAAPSQALLALATLLGRLDAIEQRGGSPALETLCRRGLTPAERARLSALVETATRAAMPAPGRTLRASRAAELLALYRWYADWSATARAVIARKDWLVVLGVVGRRRARGAGEDAIDEEENRDLSVSG